VNIRWGKAQKGSAPKRRTVLTVFDWSTEVVEHWVREGLPRLQAEAAGLDLFPSERGTLMSESALNARFRRYRDEFGLDRGLDLHSFRRSYVTHLIEAGFDPPAAAAPPPTPVTAAIADCTATVEDPHISTNPASVISKARYKCTSRSHTIGFSFLLFVCPNPPTGPESDWPNQGCSKKGQTAGSFNAGVGATTTRYVPDVGAPNARGKGYWVSCTNFWLDGNTSVYQLIRSPHTPYINYP
jgi:hypothetical protein